MNVIVNVILAVQMLAALAMIGLILIQHGKGADMGAAFGSGSSGSLFGASGSANFLSRTTAVLAAVFFVSTLALAYFGSVLVLESVFRALTGQDPNSFAVVVSTLTIAALFVPLRRRVQAAIDRRFFRQKYDAARTLAGFAAAARDEVDLDRLSAELVDVVDGTLQPEHVALWLRPGRLPLASPVTGPEPQPG